MRATTNQAGIVLAVLVMALTLTACVRPYPGSEASASQPTLAPVDTQPTVQAPEIVATPVGIEPTAESVEAVEPTEVPPEATAVPATEETHVVQAGDTLFSIALTYNVTVDEIAAANGISDINSLEIGQELLIPAPGSAEVVEGEATAAPSEGQQATDGEAESQPTAAPTQQAVAPGGVHVIQAGENLFRIGLQYGCSVEELARHNGITAPNRIPVGLEIEIPDCS